MHATADLMKQASSERKIKMPTYDRNKLSAGVAHIGVGNFHRAHQAFYTHRCLHLSGQESWAICGIEIMPNCKAFAETFRGQNTLYTLTEYAPQGDKNVHLIGSIIHYLYAPEDRLRVIECLANPSIKIVSLTITEGGYNIESKSGAFDFRNPKIIHDLQHPDRPQTVFGFLAAALDIRRKKGLAPFTVLSCDNLQHNGRVTKKALLSFAETKNKALAEWIEAKAAFPNAMVDRITPAVKPEDIDRLRQANKIDDKAPVFCEDFIQWVIEDKFCSGRPDWASAGVTFTDDITDYETVKLRLLNASHSMLAYPAVLAGFKLVHEAMGHALMREYLKTFMDEDVTPVIKIPQKLDLTTYKKTLIERFSNPYLQDQLRRLCADGASKLPVFLFPTLQSCLEQNRDVRRIAFLLACYRRHLTVRVGDPMGFTDREPALDKEDLEKIIHADPKNMLKIKAFMSIDFSTYPSFMEKYLAYNQALQDKNALNVLSEIVNKNH